MDNTEEIHDTPMVVTISGPSYAEFELIDIPGYRTGPTKDDEATRAMTIEAIAPEHALILLVIKADDDTITGNPVYGEIQKLGKMEQTIGCLTFLDMRIHESYVVNEAAGTDEYLDTQTTRRPNFENRLLPLLAHCREDKHKDIANIRDIVGVWNREVLGYENDVALVQMNEQESSLFNSLSNYLLDDEKQNALLGKVAWLKSDAAQAKWRENRPLMKQRVRRMRGNIGIEQVVKKMNVFLHAYVKSAWRQKTLNRTLPIVEKTIERIKNTCGPDLMKMMMSQETGIMEGADESMFRIFCESPRFIVDQITVLACARTEFSVKLNFENGASFAFGAAPPASADGNPPPPPDDDPNAPVKEQIWDASQDGSVPSGGLRLRHSPTAPDDDSLSVWKCNKFKWGKKLKSITVNVTSSVVPTQARKSAELPKLYLNNIENGVSQVIYMNETEQEVNVLQPGTSTLKDTMKAAVDKSLLTVERFLRNRIKGQELSVALPFTFNGLFDAFINNGKQQNQFYLVSESLTWQQHHECARAQGDHLASITSQEEMDEVVSLAAGNDIWIGGMRRTPNNGRGSEDWKWSDGRKWDYTHWADGEPNNWGGNENRVNLHCGGKSFNDLPEDRPLPAVYRSPMKESAKLKELIMTHIGNPQGEMLAPMARTVLTDLISVTCMVMYTKQKEDCDQWIALLLDNPGGNHSNPALDIHWWTVTALLEAFFKWTEIVMMGFISAEPPLMRPESDEFVYPDNTLYVQIEEKLEAFVTSVFDDHESIYKAHRFHTLQKALKEHMKETHKSSWPELRNALSMDILNLNRETPLLNVQHNTHVRSAAAPLLDLANRFTSKVMNYATRLQIAIQDKLNEQFTERKANIFQESEHMVKTRTHLMQNFHSMSEQFTKIQKMSELFDDNDGIKDLEPDVLQEMKRRLIMEYHFSNPDDRVPL